MEFNHMQRLPHLRPLPLLIASLFLSHAATAADASPTAPAALYDTSDQTIQTVQVTAVHLKSQRVDLSPRVGTTVYSIDRHAIDNLPQGADTPFNEVLLRLPGVDQDSKASGSLHIRDEHGNIQYRINGVLLPESISGFGTAIDTRLVDQIDFMTGALPAQYGLRTAGVVDIQTKEGARDGGRIGLQVGTRGDVEPSAEVFGTKGKLGYYLSGSFLRNDSGIENPQPTRNALHDQAHQGKSFGNLSYFLDDDTRIGLMFGTYNGRFQIPNNPGQSPGFSLTGQSNVTAGTSTLASSDLNETQREANHFAVLSLQKSLGKLDYQISAFHQYSELHYYPDPVGDLVYNGVASDTLRSNSASGLQLDGSYKLNDSHTVRAGIEYTRQVTHSDNRVAVFPSDSNGMQSATVPLTIMDNSGKTGKLFSLYLQDEWHIAEPLTLNYGLRYDQINAFTDEHQWSPRVNLSYKVGKDTALHAGYSRYFTPPPQELTAQSSIDLYTGTTNAPAVPFSDNVKAERTSYYDIGISHQATKKLTLTADVYYKNIHNLLDEGQFGQALILSPFNYERGFAKGLELSAIYSDRDWGAYFNFATQKAMGRHIVSGQYLFGQDELAYIAQHDIFLDHDQTFTASTGMHYHFGDSQVTTDLLYGSGLRKTPDGGGPNSRTLPSYVTINFAYTHEWKNTAYGNIEGRVALLNAFDRSYLLRDGSGVGVGAPQFGAGRSLYAGLAFVF
jgi:outer membrane receptor protein involved in Fe transport